MLTNERTNRMNNIFAINEAIKKIISRNTAVAHTLSITLRREKREESRSEE